MMRRLLVASVALACTLAGCATTSTKEQGALAAVPYETTAQGERVVVVRDYIELQKRDGNDVHVRVQYVWNYDRGLTQRRTWDEQGIAYEAMDMPGMTLNATSAELEWMWKVLRADRHWSQVLKDDMDYYGGFSFREASGPCSQGSRCVHAIVMRDDGRERILHGIFDFATGRLVDDDVDPTLTGIGQRNTSNGEKP